MPYLLVACFLFVTAMVTVQVWFAPVSADDDAGSPPAAADSATVSDPERGAIAGTVSVRGAKNAEGTVVFVMRIEGSEFDPPEEHAAMDQKHLTFIPHVLPVLSGTTVEFLNSDDVLHNVFTPDKEADKFNLGTWPKGEVRSYTFVNDKCEGAVCAPVMLCNVHPEMEAYVVILPTPYFTLADAKGSYRIEGVPRGEYRVTTWHEKAKKTTVETVTVVAGESVSVDFAIRR
jgi:plastocyanin